MRLIAAIAIGIALGGAPAAAEPASRAEIQKETRLIAQLAQATGPYAALIQESETLTQFDLQSVLEAETLLSNGTDAGQVKSWVADWSTQADARLRDLQAHLASAPPVSPALLSEFAHLSPAFARQARDIAGMPAASAKIVGDSIRLTDAIKTDLITALAHDPESVQRLSLSVLEGMRGEIDGENAYMKLSMSTSGERHPQYALSQSIIESNEASVELLDAMEGSLKGEAVDAKALAASVRTHCAAARTDAERIGPLAAAMRGQLAVVGRQSPDLQARWYKAWDTYGDSAQVEIAIAGQCDKIADQLDQGVSPAKAAASADQLKPLADRRVALSEARRLALSQSQ
jgi:hypothetical protein